MKYYYNGVHFIYNILSNKSIKDALDPSQCLSAWTEYQANCKKDFDIFEKEIKELKWE